MSRLYKILSYYAKSARPFNELLIWHPTGKQRSKHGRPKTPFIWSAECQKAFDLLIETLANPPGLGYSNFREPFYVTTDASLDGLESVLYQRQKGIDMVIAYASRGLGPSENKLIS